MIKDFRQVILDFPHQFKVDFGLMEDLKISPPAGGFRNVIFCGMGGSIIPAEILFALFPKLPDNFHIHRDFDLPPWAAEEDLIICISWSGGTKETISSYETAKKIGAAALTITKGGKLAELSEENGDKTIILPQEEILSRSGAGYMSRDLLTVLANSGTIEFQLGELASLEEKLKPETLEERGKELAERIGRWTPLIYSSFQNRFLASFWKVKFNENSKIHAFWNHFPNAAHNEIAGFGWDNFFAILLKDDKDGDLQQNKISAAVKFFEEIGIPFETIELKGKTRLEKIFNDYLLSDWTSYYLARNRSVEPAEAEMIEKFKKMEK